MKKRLRIVLSSAVLLLLAAAVASSIYFYRAYQAVKQAPPKQEAKASDIVTSVGKLMELPAEEPTVATVSDAQKLKDQQFFVLARDGDVVLIYSQAKKAILYRPSVNKIIDVAPIHIAPPATESASPSGTSRE